MTLSRPVALLCLAIALGFVGLQFPRLWREYQSLKRAWVEEEASRTIDYDEVSPQPNYAKMPANWCHDEGDRTLLWAGWDRKANKHQWFRLARGEIDPARLSHARGRDTVRPIDWPMHEGAGGSTWDKVPSGDVVAVAEIEGVRLAYPLKILGKVLVVNDIVKDRPIVIVFTPFVPDDVAVEIFDPARTDQRLILAYSGYLIDGNPLLFDRRTESFWSAEATGLRAVSGSHKGELLPRLARASAVSWGDWKVAHPESRLLIGAFRSPTVAGR